MSGKKTPCLIILGEGGSGSRKKREELEKLTDCVFNSPATNPEEAVVRFWKGHGVSQDRITVLMSIEAQLAMRAERGDDQALRLMLGLSGADSRIVLNWHKMEMAEKRLKLEEEKMRMKADSDHAQTGLSELMASLNAALEMPGRDREIGELLGDGQL